MSTITLTFGDCAENHVGMQQVGEKADKGFNREDLDRFVACFADCKVEKFQLHFKKEHPEAYFYIVREGFKKHKELFEVMKKLDWDKKAFMKGRVVNKKARYNLCFDDKNQEPDYENGKGRIIDFNSIPLLQELNTLITTLPEIGNLKIEGNYYYDINDTYIGEHSDLERKKVVGVRFGESFPLIFRWYHKFEPVSDKMGLNINGGDIYFMSEKAVGPDGRKSSIFTLRHSAGLPHVLDKIDNDKKKNKENKNKEK